MYGAKSTYTKNQRPHGNTTLGLEGKPTNRINKTAVRPSIEPGSNTAWQHHLNNGGAGGKGGRGRSWSGVIFLAAFFHFFFTFFALLIYACSLFHFFLLFSLFFSLVCFRRFQPFLAKNSELSGFCSTPSKKGKKAKKVKNK